MTLEKVLPVSIGQTNITLYLLAIGLSIFSYSHTKLYSFNLSPRLSLNNDSPLACLRSPIAHASSFQSRLW